MIGGYAVAHTLQAAGCDVIFSLCGGHISPIYDGCVEVGIEVVDTRHEQSAVHAADAYARLRRQVGVAVLTAGPGITDGITGIANAYFSNSPVVVLGGAPATDVMGRGALQEMDQLALVRGITKEQITVTDVNRVAERVAYAIQTAQSGVPGPVFVELPFDVLSAETENLELEQARFQPLRQPADPEVLDQIAALLSESKRPFLFVGSAVWWDDAGKAVETLAELGLPVYANGMGRGVLMPEHECAFQLSRSHAFANADVAIFVGAPFDFRLGYGRSIASDCKIVFVDRDLRRLGQNRTPEHALHADAKSTLDALRPLLPDDVGAQWSEWRDALRDVENTRRDKFRAWENDDSGPVNHFRLAKAINDVMDENTIVIGDGGDCVSMAAKVLRPRGLGRWLDPGPFGTLGVGAPFALAAKWVHRDSRVIVLIGDGTFGLTGFDFETCVRFNLPITIVIANDAAWGQIRVPQVQRYGKERSVGSLLAPTRYDEIVKVFGGDGEHVETGAGLDAALVRAKESNKVYAINVSVDPDFIADNSLSRFTVK